MAFVITQARRVFRARREDVSFDGSISCRLMLPGENVLRFLVIENRAFKRPLIFDLHLISTDEEFVEFRAHRVRNAFNFGEEPPQFELEMHAIRQYGELVRDPLVINFDEFEN